LNKYKIKEEIDLKFMNLAMNLAKKNTGKTSENPTVGCVIVKNGKIIATGITSKRGRPHAEKNAIDKIANQEIVNLTMYVTLEPCFHYGNTGPCVDLISKNQFSRIVIACQDPDNRVSGKSIKKLKENGLQVDVGLLSAESIRINRGFFSSKINNKPFISLKLATSLDGKIATKNFDSKWISSKDARNYTNLLRSKNDAILIGSNTLKKDNPSLDCRIDGLENLSPVKIVLSDSLNFEVDYNIFNKGKKTYIATKNSNKEKYKKYQILNNVEILFYSNLPELLSKLTKIGINSILIEGGSKIAASFLKENLIDEIIHVQSSKILGGDAINAINNLNLNSLTESFNFRKINSRNFADDQITIYGKSHL
jgi:diaminohydroxyphosphoribosylaminopyrimidine deaminase / 5-amino-6-(5-phosphoribosylamino)uracil reductase